MIQTHMTDIPTTALRYNEYPRNDKDYDSDTYDRLFQLRLRPRMSKYLNITSI